VVTQPQTYS